MKISSRQNQRDWYKSLTGALFLAVAIHDMRFGLSLLVDLHHAFQVLFPGLGLVENVFAQKDFDTLLILE